MIKNTRPLFRSLLDTSGGTSGGIISSGDKVGVNIISRGVNKNVARWRGGGLILF